jgi:hypothetical protein
MNRNLVSALTIAATAAAAVALAALASEKAYADDITFDQTPFASTRTRAEVKTELLRQGELLRTGSAEWSLQRNEVPRIKSSFTAEQARSGYKFSRDEVRALTGEDSGSAYFKRAAVQNANAATRGGQNANATEMGGPAQ